MSNTATFNTSPNLKLSKKLSFGEEVANSVTHAVGAMAMLVLLPITAVHANNGYGITAAVGMSVFVISLFLMFLSSAIYHAMDYNSPHKMVLRIIDHSMIYIAIAGSYTPVALSLVGGWLGYSIIVLQWGTTIFGILYKIFAKKINEKFSLFLYLMMGWLVIFIIPAIVTKTGPALGTHACWRIVIHGWCSFLCQEKALLPHDLAPLHHVGFGSSIYGDCLLYASLKPKTSRCYGIIWKYGGKSYEKRTQKRSKQQNYCRCLFWYR